MRVKIFGGYNPSSLEREVNEFLEGNDAVSVEFSTSNEPKHLYSDGRLCETWTKYYCMVVIKERSGYHGDYDEPV